MAGRDAVRHGQYAEKFQAVNMPGAAYQAVCQKKLPGRTVTATAAGH
jgi:hypothetical protein